MLLVNCLWDRVRCTSAIFLVLATFVTCMMLLKRCFEKNVKSQTEKTIISKIKKDVYF